EMRAPGLRALVLRPHQVAQAPLVQHGPVRQPAQGRAVSRAARRNWSLTSAEHVARATRKAARSGDFGAMLRRPRRADRTEGQRAPIGQSIGRDTMASTQSMPASQRVVQVSLFLVAAIAIFGGALQMYLGEPQVSPRLDNVHRFMAGVYLST